jgi:hypothetical protein
MPKPNSFLLYLARKSYDEDSNCTADYFVELAISDPIGGSPARDRAMWSYINDRIRTRRWLNLRTQGMTPSAIVLAEILEEEGSPLPV